MKKVNCDLVELKATLITPGVIVIILCIFHLPIAVKLRPYQMMFHHQRRPKSRCTGTSTYWLKKGSVCNPYSSLARGVWLCGYSQGQCVSHLQQCVAVCGWAVCWWEWWRWRWGWRWWRWKDCSGPRCLPWAGARGREGGAVQGCPHMSACSADESEQQQTLHTHAHTHSMLGAWQASYTVSAMQSNISQKKCLKCPRNELSVFFISQLGPCIGTQKKNWRFLLWQHITALILWVQLFPCCWWQCLSFDLLTV